jgi:hypothetical protein
MRFFGVFVRPSRVVMIFEAFWQDFFGISIFGHL